jgi:hypothetical protein
LKLELLFVELGNDDQWRPLALDPLGGVCSMACHGKSECWLLGSHAGQR